VTSWRHFETGSGLGTGRSSRPPIQGRAALFAPPGRRSIPRLGHEGCIATRAPLVSRSISLPISSVARLPLARQGCWSFWASAGVRIPSASGGGRVIRLPRPSIATINGTTGPEDVGGAAGAGSTSVVIEQGTGSRACPRLARDTQSLRWPWQRPLVIRMSYRGIRRTSRCFGSPPDWRTWRKSSR
jgi:hypothetical protein